MEKKRIDVVKAMPKITPPNLERCHVRKYRNRIEAVEEKTQVV